MFLPYFFACRSSGTIEVSKAGSALLLMFKEPTADDSGMYNCSAVYDRIEKLNSGVELIFYRKFYFYDLHFVKYSKVIKFK